MQVETDLNGLLTDVEHQVGGLILNLDGTIVASSVELTNDLKTASIIYNILLDANGAISAGENKDPFKRLTVAFQKASFVVSVSNNKVYIVKRKGI